MSCICFNGRRGGHEKDGKRGEKGVTIDHESLSSFPSPPSLCLSLTRATVLTLQTEDHLLLAVPKKGRLFERVINILKGAGLDHIRANRLDVAPCLRQPVTIVFLPAADIAK
jgi:hypothetical protein